MGLLGVVLAGVLSQGGCAKDTDCKGERVCEAGVCVNPPAASVLPAPVTSDGGVALPPPPPPLPPPSEPTRRPLPAPASAPPEEPASVEYPRVVRRGALTCVESLDERGQVVERCRDAGRAVPAEPRRAGRRWDEAPPAPRGGFALDVHFRGSTLVAVSGGGAGALPALSGTLAIGGVGGGGVGGMGIVNLDVGFGSGGTLVQGTLAPALRLGLHSHATLAAGASFLTVSTFSGRASAVAFTTQVQGVIQVAGGFSIALHGGLTFDASGVMLALGAGLGFSTPSR